MIAIALENRPDFCCLVPEKRQELTTEGGLDLINNFDQIQLAVASLQQENISVSLFIEPVKKFIQAAKNSILRLLNFTRAITPINLEKHSMMN